MGQELALHIDCNPQRYAHLRKNLAPLGIRLTRAACITDAVQCMKENYFGMVLFHEEALGKKLISFCSDIAENFTGTIIIALLSSSKVKIEESLFDAGADDVASGGQINSRILTKRIKARLKNKVTCPQSKDKIRIDDILIDFQRREVYSNGRLKPLPGILKDLLKYFIHNPDRVITRKELLDSPIWADSICSSAKEGGKTFDVNIGKLRKIIEKDPKKPRIIQSVRGQGWKLGTHVINLSHKS